MKKLSEFSEGDKVKVRNDTQGYCFENHSLISYVGLKEGVVTSAPENYIKPKNAEEGIWVEIGHGKRDKKILKYKVSDFLNQNTQNH